MLKKKAELIGYYWAHNVCKDIFWVSSNILGTHYIHFPGKTFLFLSKWPQIIPLKQLTYFSQCFKQSSCWPYHKNIKVKAAAESGPCSRMVSPQQWIMLRRGYVEVGTNPLLVLWPAEHLLFNYFRFLLLLAFAEKVHTIAVLRWWGWWTLLYYVLQNCVLGILARLKFLTEFPLKYYK